MLRPCPECKKEISDRSVVCPNCGWFHESILPIEHRGVAIQSNLHHIADSQIELKKILAEESKNLREEIKNLREEIKNSKASFSLDGTSVETLAQLILFVLGLAFILGVISYCKAH